jgi:hypothetical protein
MSRVGRRIRVIALAILLGGTLFGLAPRPAKASVDIAASITDLSRAASVIAVVVPVERRSEWRSKRIVTLTRVRVSRVLEGSAGGSELVIRTLGGKVGGIAQRVEGEPDLEPGKATLVFLSRMPDGMATVAARSQGQFELVADSSGKLTVHRSRSLPRLVHRPTREFPDAALSAVIVLHRASLDAAEVAIKGAWRQAHGH